MNKNIRRILSAVLSLAMTLSLAACGEKNSSAQPGSTGADGEKNTELNVALAGEPNALDPMCGATDRTSSAVYNNIYDTLLVADEKGNILPTGISFWSPITPTPRLCFLPSPFPRRTSTGSGSFWRATSPAP